MANSPQSIRHIFISHSSKDNEFGLKIVQDLRHALSNNISVWYDASGGLQGGEAWWRTIVEHLTASDVFIVILSPDAMLSPWVNDEITLAWKQKNSPAGKHIIPVLYRLCQVREDIALLPSVSFLAPRTYEEAFNELLQVLSPQRIASPQQSNLLKRRPSRRLVIASLFAGLALTAGGLSLSQARSWFLRTATTPTTAAPLAPGTITFRGHTNGVLAVSWSPDKQLIASGGIDNNVYIWNATTARIVFGYSHSHNVNSVAWSPDGKLIASGSSDNTVQIWNAATENHALTYTGHHDAVDSVVWSPDGKHIASGSFDSTVQVWEATTGKHVFTNQRADRDTFFVAWAPDGAQFASAGTDNYVRIWDAANGHDILSYIGHTNSISSVAWSPDGKRIASASIDRTVQVWNASSGSNFLIYRGHSKNVLTAAWSPDGKRIASGGDDNTVQLWDAGNGKHLFTYRGHSNSVYSVAWSPDGKHIASGSEDGMVQVWQA